MNWQAVNFDWNQVRAFLATIEEGSLSSAARALGLTQPTLGRQVAALEQQLGVTLFERAGRQLTPTPAALEIAGHVREMGEAAMRLSLAASGQSQSVAGTVRISASEMYSAFVLPEVVRRVRDRHPAIVVDIVATNELSDLRTREADIAIRNTEPRDMEMIAKRLKDEAGGLFATPELIARHGPFRTPGDLVGVPFVGMGPGEQLLEALSRRGAPVSRESFVTGSTNHLVHWELARQGLGIGLNDRRVGRMTPRMVPVLEDEISIDYPVWLVAPRELKTSPRVRIVFDLLVEVLGQRKT